jgi:hypothetical protein
MAAFPLGQRSGLSAAAKKLMTGKAGPVGWRRWCRMLRKSRRVYDRIKKS